MVQRKAVTKQMAIRYRRASKKDKTLMLNELCALTGWSRRHARRALAQALRPARPRPKPKTRLPVYGEEVMVPLRFIWATFDGPCGKRLAPFMAEAIEVLTRCGEIILDDDQRDALLSISASTIDRRLAPERRRLQVKGRSGTKPGSMLKNQIPIRTFAEWDEARPGFCELDLVGHDGGDPKGQFAQTLNLTDVASGWTEPQAVKNKARRWVFEALQQIRAELPFDLLGIDSDNGAEFINDHLVAYCADQQITFTRSRPYRRNDNCFVEQKNWTVVRHAVGYLRYDTEEELKILNELYDSLRPYVNFFCPQMKLIEKTRQGSKVIKRYDTARTPYRRLLESSEVPERAKQRLSEQYHNLNPVALKRHVGRCQDRLVRLAANKPAPQPVRPQPAQKGGEIPHRLEDILDEATKAAHAAILT